MRHLQIKKATLTQSEPSKNDSRNNEPTISSQFPLQTKKDFSFRNISILANSEPIQKIGEEESSFTTKLTTSPSVSNNSVTIQGKFLDLFRSKSSIEKRKKREQEKQQDRQKQLEYNEEFERNLGLYLFNHPKAIEAATGAIAKMKEVMGVNSESNKAPDIFGGLDPKYAGNVGKDLEVVLEAINNGNLREKMTGFYNASLGSFKTMVEEHIANRTLSELSNKGINEKGIKAIKKRHKQRSGLLTRLFGGTRDLYVAAGDPLLRSKHDALYQGQSLRKSKQSRLEALELLKGNRIKKDELNIKKDTRGRDYSASNRTEDNLKNDKYSAGLSGRERALAVVDRDDNRENLPWEEGATRFKPNFKNSWMKEANQKLKLPVKAGPSGTVDRMLQALNFLGNPVDPLNFRLALLGWMLTSNDHSFHEMMAVSKTYGLPYKPGLYSYHNIEPLMISELRQNACLNQEYPGMFPDEIMYRKKTEQDSILGNMTSFASKNPWEFNPSNKDKKKFKKSFLKTGSESGIAAMRVYTGGSYLLQNTAMSKYPKWIRNLIMKHHIRNNDELRSLKDRYDKGEVTLRDIRREAKMHNKMLKTALKDSDHWEGKVYRGEVGKKNSYKVGNEVTYNKFTSTSKLENTAYNFMMQGFMKNESSCPFLLELNVKYGRNISEFSTTQDEAEILLPPQAKFTVTNIERKTTPYRPKKIQDRMNKALELGEEFNPPPKVNAPYFHVTLTQTSGGKYEKEHPEYKKSDISESPINQESNSIEIEPQKIENNSSIVEEPKSNIELEKTDENIVQKKANRTSWINFLSA